MVTATLNSEMIEFGRRVVEHLASDGIKIDAAFWFLLTDQDSWKLMLSGPDLTVQGPRAAYKTVQESLSKITKPTVTLDAIAILKPDSPLIALLRTGIRTGTGISGIRFSKNVVAGNLIDDAYIYRLV
jgi:hypothetical protein